MTTFSLSNATPAEREAFYHAMRLKAEGKDERRRYERVQLAVVGDHPTGGTADRQPFTRETFDKILASAGTCVPQVGISHKQPDENGLNGTGSLSPIHNVVIDVDPVTGLDALYGDLPSLPVWAAEEYPRRSVELLTYPDGRVVLSRLALLGDEAAAIPDLPPMPEGAELIAAAAVIGTIADTSSPTNQPSPTGPEHTEEGASIVDLNELRESLGLEPGTSDTDILAAAIAGAKAKPTEPTADEIAAKAKADADALAQAEADQAAAAEAEKAKAKQPVAIDPDVLADLQAKAALGEQANATLQEQEAETLVTAAFGEARITEAAKGDYKADLLAGGTRAKEARVLLTAAADAGGLAPGRTGAPIGGMVGHSVTASASNDPSGAISDAEYEAYVKAQNGATA